MTGLIQALIYVVQDESIYKSYAAQSKAWFLKDQQVIRKKGEGRGVMASGFLTEVLGMILLCNEDLQHINNMRTIKGKCCKIEYFWGRSKVFMKMFCNFNFCDMVKLIPSSLLEDNIILFERIFK